MSEALITPKMISWARERAGLRVHELAGKISQKEEKLQMWETGELRPTFIQAQNLAKTLHIPFGYLFLKEPPVEEELIPDLRTISDSGLEELSVDLKDVINDSLRKQDWYGEFLKDAGHEPLPFIGKFNINTPTEDIVTDLITVLEINVDDKNNASNWEDYLRLLVSKSEDAGIWVMRNNKVGNNTHRILKVEEFRGFALCDDYAPLILLNSSDAKAAQIFTLIHEIAHLWLGESGLSDLGLNTDINSVDKKIEKKCNEVAAQFLVPKDLLLKRWDNKDYLTSISINSKFFKVSKVVIARRAFDLGFVTKDQYFAFYENQREQWKRQKEKLKSNDGGPPFYKMIPISNGKKFTEAVVLSVFSQQTLIRNGARLLGVKPSKIDNVAVEVGIA